MIFDTHAHYDDRAFDEDREELLSSLQEHGIGAVVDIGAGLESSQAALGLAGEFGMVYASVGIHPEEAAQMDQDSLKWLEEKAALEKVVAIGEIGLDYYWDQPARNIQKDCFLAQVNLARKVGLPMVVHSRDAARDTLDILKAEKAGEAGGVIHCFSYPVEIARECLNMGFYLGIGGVVTFQNGKKLKEVVEYMPLDRMLLETDCPYLAPVPFRGKRNSSLYLTYVVEAISRIKKVPPEQVIEATDKNARAMYGIDGR